MIRDDDLMIRRTAHCQSICFFNFFKRALLEIENIKTFTNEKGGKVNTSNATKPDLVNEIVRHFELIDKAGRGASSSASARTSSVEVGKKKKEKKDKEKGDTGGASGSKKKK